MPSHLLPALVVLLLLAAPAAAEVNLPDIGDPASTLVTPAQEDRFGEELLREFRRVLPLVDDPLVESYIQSLGQRLASSAPDARGRFRFIVVRDPRVNAFAAPGGIIGVNTGLITAARNESELAGVLAHEVAHVTQRHLARMYASSTRMDLITGLAVLAGLIAGAHDSAAGQAAVTAAVAANVQSQINHTRTNEQEADRIGLRILAAAGFDTGAMPDFFERMMELNRHNPDSIPEFLRTHPVSAARLADTRGRAEQYGRVAPPDGRTFRLIQARAHALTVSPAAAVRDLEEGHVAGSDRAAQEYGIATAKLRDGRHDEALTLLARLDAKWRDDLFIGIPLAEALARTGEPQEALEILARLNEVYPDYLPVAHARARLLMELRRPGEALRLLDRTLAHNTEEPVVLKLKSEAAAAAGRPALGHEAMADYYRLHGQYTLEIEQLEQALRQPDADEHAILRLNSKLTEARRLTRKRMRER